MKKIIIYSLILGLLLHRYGFRLTYDIQAQSNILKVPSVLNVVDNESEFQICLNVQPGLNQRVKILLPREGYLESRIGENSMFTLESDGQYLVNKGDTINVKIAHETLNVGEWSAILNIAYTIETYREYKTVYSYKTVASWNKNSYTTNKPDGPYMEEIQYGYQEVTCFDENNFLLSKPSGTYKEVKQYGYKEVMSFDTNNYSLEKPSGNYKEATQFASKSRSSYTTSEPYSYYTYQRYNATGKCPNECTDRINFYGTGCECWGNFRETGYKDITHYTDWTLDENSWRFDEEYPTSDLQGQETRIVYLSPLEYSEEKGWTDQPYQESDTILPVSRTIYLLPKEQSKATGWRDTPYQQTETIIPITRTIYYSPSSFSEFSNWQDNAPNIENAIIQSKQVFRVKDGEGWSEWKDIK